MLKSLEETLSAERLTTYISLTEGNLERAIRLYLWNAELSESLQMPVHVLEVAVRNTIHKQLSCSYGVDWYDNPDFPIKPALQKIVQEVKRAIISEGKLITPPRIITGLSMGFWVLLLSKRYETPLWRPCLHNAFPYARKSFGRSQARLALDNIRKMRNRIAHHEPILTKNPDLNFALMLEVISWVSKNAAIWVEYNCRFNRVWNNRPF
jgi:hypothetical protein